MEAKNLMYGDWYSALNGSFERDNYQFEFDLDYWDSAKPEPIPLTPKILEANGFYLGRTSQEEDLASAIGMHLRGKKWCIDDGDVEVTVSFPNESDGGMVTIDNLSDKYMQFIFDETIFVHEFQQELRLCGLNDIADGFKIK